MKFKKEWNSKWYFEANWDHSWQMTHQLIDSFGSFIFVADQQYLIGNLFASKLGYRFKDLFRAEFGGHYYRNTLIYRDWNVNGSIHWQF